MTRFEKSLSVLRLPFFFTSASLSLSSFERMSRDKERALDEQIAQLQREVLDLDHRLRHEREKLADIELFIAGGTLGNGLPR